MKLVYSKIIGVEIKVFEINESFPGFFDCCFCPFHFFCTHVGNYFRSAIEDDIDLNCVFDRVSFRYTKETDKEMIKRSVIYKDIQDIIEQGFDSYEEENLIYLTVKYWLNDKGLTRF